MKDALAVFRAALRAADPEQAVHRHLRREGDTLIAGGRRYGLKRFDRIQLIGAGKAGAAMARAVERVLGKDLLGGFVNVPDGVWPGVRRVILNPCGHPIPDRRGLSGARRIEAIARAATSRDLLICVISGGASALLPSPAPPVTLGQMRRATSQLLTCGATIDELNTVRKHLETLKGGQLARIAAPARVISLILSDVVGDDPGVIGSGATAGDTSSFADAARIFEKYGIVPPLSVAVRMALGARGEIPETPRPSEIGNAHNLIAGSNRLAIDAAAAKARELGYRTMVLSTFVEGEAADAAKTHAAIVKEILTRGRPLRPPACVLSGGETTVTVRGEGLGGRNQEFVLAAAIALEGFRRFTILSAGTDGIDGPTDAAGAVADENTLARARALGLDPRQYLRCNDSYRFFERAGGLIKTGPTGTNVMDVRVLLAV
jgi:hydroxypyruvate reductase